MKKLLLLILLVWSSMSAMAQETNCGNGIDDDGDGFIDCFDSNCANSVSCKDFYVGRDKLCQVPPTGTASFGMKVGAKSPTRATWTSGRMVVGDLDNDGIPEVVTLHQDDKKLYILDGRDLTVKFTGTITGTAEYFDHVIGNVKRDACAEIFIAEKDASGTFYISSYDCKGILQWRKPIYGQPITMGLADFDEDGKVELYYRNEILDAETGTRLVKGSGDWTTIDAGPVAVDMLDVSATCTKCAGLELVLGGNIYGVDLGARTVDAGSISLAKSIPAGASYFPKKTSFGWVTSLTSVADYNLDGSLDVVMSGASGSTGGATTVFLWDVKNGTYKTYQPPNNWQHGTGRLNIADVDGDGKSNATFVSGNRLYALKEDFTKLWEININEGTSGYTGTTVFDFNNDNAVEIVYRDESYLYIINGKTGSVFTSATCRSRTANDYPIVADVDGDGSTEICVTCATNDGDDINDINRAPYGQVRTYKSNLQAWVPARKVWNQHGYFNVNVNDDLTIPRIQQKHHLVFSTGSCTTGANRALNTFLNQSPFLDSKGCPTYASADITYEPGSVQIIPPTCPDQAFTVSLKIKNIGDLGLSGTLPITFYQGNPTQAGAVKLNTVNIPLTKFNVGDVVSLTNLSVQGSGNNFTLYVVMNDNGTTVPTPIKLPNSTFSECNYTNNIVSASVTPSPFTIQASLISNNIKCTNNAVADNGAAEVYRLVSGVKVTTGYNFYWFNGAVAGDTATAAFKGAVRTGLAAGTYTIIAYHKGIKCGSTSTQIAIINEAKTITAAITEVKPFTNCKTPDGEMKVTLNGGAPTGNFTYQWFEGNVFGTSPVLSTSNAVTKLSSVTYSVLVTEKATGCQILESAKVTDKTTRPVVVATSTAAKCAPANSGGVSANVGGNTSNYDFAWYIGSSVKPSADFTTASVAALTAGDYTVVATQKLAGCSSDPVVVTIASNTSVPVTTSVIAQQTSCTTPNGSANALVAGSTTGYTFKWFKGNNTLVANLIAGTSTITGLAAGIYTVEATNTANGCVDTEIVTIIDAIVTPTIASASVTSHLTQCAPFNGSVTASAGAGAFKYYWFNGNVGTPDTVAANFKGATWTGLKAGYYTVVAVDKATRCASARSLVQVLDNTVNPVVTTATVNQTSCTAGTPNGQASATVGGITTGYKFRWFAGSDTSTFLTQAASITNRAAATYTVKAINLTTKCYTTAQVTISNNLVNPVLTSTIANNVNCTGVTPTGSVTLQVNGGVDPITDFTIQWYEGNGTTVALGTTVGSTSGTNKEKAQGLSAGVYTVRVTDNTIPGNGCYIISTFNITNTPAAITIDNADISLTSQSNCSPVNGSATVNEITLNGTGAGNTTGYTFTWYQSNGTTVIPSSGTAATIGTALAAGSYFVKATNPTTNCTSALTGFTISNSTATPAVTAATTLNNTNCTGATGNGSITINVGGIAPVAAQFSIAWFEGSGTTTALGTTVGTVTGSANQTAQGLPAGTYTVRVTDASAPNLGCATTTSFTITNTPATVTIDNADIAVTAQSNCTPVNGSATVNEMTLNGTGIGNTTGYTFTWYQSNGTTVIPGSGTGATVGTALAAGSYFVKAVHGTTNCSSSVTGFTIGNTTTTPVVAAASTLNNTNCTGATGNGSITINVGGATPVAGQYTISWFEGSGTTTALGTTVGSVAGAANQTAQGLPAGTYTVRVTDIASPNVGCATTTSFTITNTPAVVTIDNADITLTPQSDCSPVNGSATVSEITLNGTGLGNTTGYTFTWYQSNGTTVIPGSGATATVGTLLAAGSYFVKATSSASTCVSALSAFTITNTTTSLAVTAATTLNNTNCTGATGNGSITINVGGVAPVAGQYTIAWFEGSGTTTALGTNFGSVTGAANQTAQALPAGTYTVRVTDLLSPNNGCSTTTSFTITNTPAVVTIDNADIAVVPQSDCTPVNGNATVNEITLNGAGIGNTTGYTFTWYQSNGTTVIPGSGTTATVGTALAAGSYFVKATNTATNCTSVVTGFTIANTAATPVVAAATTLNNTNCTGTTGNGSITINVGGVAPVAGQYTIAWFEGNGTTTALGTNFGSVTGAANQTAQGLPAGTYTVRVTDLVTPNNGCSTTTSFTITDTPAVVTIDNADIAVVSQSDCTPVNGSATVNEITVNGAGIGNTTGYTFTWYQSNGTTVIPGSGTTATVGSPLAAGSYYVKATNATTNCTSTIAAFTITNTTATPVVAAATTLNNTNCTGATGNGSITINVGGVAPVAGQYTIAWFEGSGTTTALGTTVGSVTGAANQTAQALPAGTYTVRVTDLLSPNNGCSTTTSFTITNTPAVVTIDNADIAVVPQSDCTPVNGNATVNEITLNGAGIGNTTGYTFTWYQSNGTTVIPGSGTTATIGTALAAGNYFVKATNTATNCTSVVTGFTIANTAATPVVAAATTLNNTNCTGTTGNGSITINVGGVAPVAGQYTIAWFEGNGTTTALGTNFGSVTGAANQTAQGLPAGTYTVRVTDLVTPNNGCSTTTSFTITDTPAVVTIDNADIAVVSQSDCTPVNGSATVNEITVNGAGIGNTTGYTFTWYQSNGTTVIPGSGTTATVGSPLAAGSYYVKATNATTNCTSAIAAFTITNTTATPVVAAATTLNNTNCTGATGNGSITINVGGVAPVAGQYTIAWFEGSGTTTALGTTVGSVTGAANQTAQALPAGTYTVRVTDLLSPNNGCSTTTSFTITNTPAVVTIDNADIAVVPQSDCTPVNGNATVNEITLNGAGIGNTTGYTFTWYQSNGTTVIPGSGTTATVGTALAAGSYYVKATNPTSACSSALASFTINPTHSNPTVTVLTSLDNTNCSGVTANGSITIQLNGGADPATAFIIDWFEGTGITVPLGTTIGTTGGVNNEIAQAIKGGTYTVRVRDNATPNVGCSVTASFTIGDNVTYPVVTGLPLPNTACDVTKSNGSITANVGGLTAGYTFHIFRGQNTLAANEVTSGPAIASNLAAGVYTVQAITNASGCPATSEVTVINNITLPTIVATNDTNVTSCSTPNGTASVTAVSIGLLTDYTFSWYSGRNIKATADYTGSTITALLAGEYTVTATNNVLGCDVQIPVTVTVDNDPTTLITINELLSEQVSPAICNDGLGQLGVEASSPVNIGGFAFDWFAGDKNIGMTAEGSGQNFPVNSNRISNAASSEPIGSGLHTVIVRDLTSGCRDSLTINLPYSDEAALLSILTSPQVDCLAPDGAFRASIQPSLGTSSNPANSALDQGWYEIQVYQYGALIKTVAGVNGTPITDPIVVTGLAAGNYTVLAVETRVPPLPGCSSEPNYVTIGDSRAYPAITANALVDNQNCVGSVVDTGSISLTIDGTPNPPSGYSYSWYDGKLLTDPSLPAANVLAPGHSAINIDGGFYTVQVTDAVTSCKAKETIYINNTPHVIAIAAADLDVTPQTDCSPANGTATVLDVSIDGASSGGTAGYTFAWFLSNGTSVIPSSSTTASVGTPIDAGTYFVSATNAASNCTSPLVQFNVDDTSVQPVIASSALTDNSNCSGATPNGSVTITVDGAAPVFGEYSIQWYTGVDTSSPLAGAISATLANLAAGDYTVEVIDLLSPGNTCSNIATFTIGEDLPVYAIPAASITLTDQTDCVANGSATVTDILIDGVTNGGTAGFTFEWFDANGVVVPGSGTAATVGVVLDAADYRVVATNTASQCSAIIALFTIDDLSVQPVIASSALTDNSNCSGATPNGSVTITVDGAAPVPAEFSIQWYTGIGTTSPIVGATTATIGSLAAGDYTVEVIDLLSPGNTCSNIATFTIGEDLPVYAIPAASITLTDQTDCVANGSATVTDILIDGVTNGGTAGFTFEWFDANGVVVPGSGTAATVGVVLGAADYRVVATNTASQCSAIIALFTIDDLSVQPVITSSALTDNSNCSGATPNGSVTITVDGAAPVPAEFSIQWYTGIGTTSPIVGATTATIGSLAAGDYTVEVIDLLSPGNTCSNIATFTIGEDLPVYAIPAASITLTDQTDCVANGSATVTDILIDGVTNGGTAGFTFEWFDANGVVVPGSGTAATVGVVLGAADYRVVATNTASQCSAIIALFTIDDLSVQPVIASSALTDNSNCSGATPNGSVTITVDGAAPVPAEFSIQWYTGIGTTSPIVGATTATIGSLAAGDYTVEVIDLLSPGNTCSNIATFTIGEDLPVYAIPAASITLTDQTDCVANGSATVTDILIDGVTNGGTAGFTFEWFDANGVVVPGSGTAATVGVVLGAADYRVVATNTASQCSAIIALFTIDDLSVQPVIASSALTDNSNCSGATPNGSVTITVDGAAPVPAEFSIQWYTGIGTTSPIVGATTATIGSLAAGDYTVEVIDLLSPGNTCSNIATFTIGEDLPVYAIPAASITLTDQTDCVANGSATVTDILIDGVTNGGTAGFTFEWFDANGVVVPGSGTAATVGVVLGAADYRVVATNTASQCSAIIALFTIDDLSVQPVIASSALTDNSNCSGATPNGSVTITVDGAAPVPAEFSIQWYTGIGTTSPIVGATTATIGSLAAGDYTVEVIDLLSPGNTCSNIATFTIGEDLPVYAIPAASITLTDQTDCVANGSATVTDILIDGVTNGGTAGFTFEWFDANGVVVPGSGTAATVGVVLGAADYRVVATNTASQCSAIIALFTIDDLSVQPVIASSALTDNSNCSGATPNGSVTITVDGAAPVFGEYSIQWYTGVDTSSPLAGAISATLANLAAGDYTVEVIDLLSPGNTCSNIATFTIGEDLPVYAIPAASITLTDQTDCVANGSATVTDILIDGVTNGGTAGFTFEWFDANGVVVPGSGTAATVGVVLGAADYRVVATNTTSQCSAIIALFTIDDLSVQPVIASSALTDNSNCSGATPNGSVTITVDGAAPVPAEFSIQWYTGIGTTSPIVGATTATIGSLAAGDYTVEVIDLLSPGNTCSNIATFTIGEDLPVYAIPAASITLTDQTDCVANGSATVTDILIDGVTNGGTAGFTFEWFDANGVVVPGSGTAATVGVVLGAADYRVVATNTASQCSAIIALFTIDDLSVQPVIASSALTDNSNCSGATPNGSVTITVDGAAPVPAEFSIQWYTGIGTTSPIVGATTATIGSLAAGDYTVEVTDILSPGSSCASVATFTIDDTPTVIGIDNSVLTLTDNSDCQPINGSAVVTGILVNGVPVANTAGYTFEWLHQDMTVVDPGNGPTVGINLVAGDYFVRATNVVSNCITPLTPFTIEDITTTPVVVAVKNMDNIACNTNYTGAVSASVSEGFTNGITAGYVFEWYAGANNTNPADLINTGAVLAGLAEGAYTVRVIDNTAPSVNCSNVATVTIDRLIPVVNGTLLTSAQTVCAPIQDGNMTVNTVQQFLDGAVTTFNMNNAADLSKFAFQWFDANLASLSPSTPAYNISPNLETGTFYVQVTDALGCTSDYIEASIEDQTTKPAIAVDEFTNPAICVLPEVRGSIFVSADNNQNFGDYTFEWYEGATTAGTLVEPNSPFLGNIAYTGALTYTVKAINNATQCFTLETYKFATDTVAIQVVASAVPLTSCVADNGSLFAATRTGSGQLYNIEWYIGSGVGGTPDFTSNEVLIAPIGNYTAIARHPTLNFCTSIADTVSVTDGRMYPVVVATQKDPSTYCDPANPNGVAEASVNGSILGYTFDWYEGALSANSVYTGSQAGVLKPTTYVVKATDAITGCPGTTTITITSDPVAIPLPQIALLSDRTDCGIMNGSLSASVNDVTKDYIFNWYNGAAIKNQVDATGEFYNSLDAGIYTVTATDRISGCTSGPVQKEVIADMDYPEFDINTIATNCNDAIGRAELVALNDGDVQAIEWNIQGAIETGPQISNLPAGTFSVTVITVENCETTKTFAVKTDITVYNGVSRNNDGLNDIFEVGCIGEFPNNSVRIFNRAGSLVFEATGYDNQDTYFNGISNRGINILGNELPDGTYFYIINKNDGTEQRTGYLELLH